MRLDLKSYLVGLFLLWLKVSLCLAGGKWVVQEHQLGSGITQFTFLIVYFQAQCLLLFHMPNGMSKIMIHKNDKLYVGGEKKLKPNLIDNPYQ